MSRVKWFEACDTKWNDQSFPIPSVRRPPRWRDAFREMKNAPTNCSVFVPVQQLPETPDLPSSATELLLGLQPRFRLPTLQGGRCTLRKAAFGLLHPRAISALQPVAVTIRELSEPPPFAHRGRSASPLLQIDLSVPDDRALESSLRLFVGDFWQWRTHSGAAIFPFRAFRRPDPPIYVLLLIC